MTKKITITLEENLIHELTSVASMAGKKKTQIVREALKEYFSLFTKNSQSQLWQKENQKNIDLYNESIDSKGAFSDSIRSF